MPDQRVFCILTPPRSGSSLTARIMNILGVYLGREEGLVPGSDHNRKGYWEHENIISINNALLDRLGIDYSRAGANWTGEPVFPAGWEMDPGLRDLSKLASELIQAEFSGHPVWGWKDPRTCFTLPFWKRLLPEMQ